MAEWLFEQVLAAMESQCHERMQDAMKTKEGFGIEYDENVACDVCRTVRVTFYLSRWLGINRY